MNQLRLVFLLLSSLSSLAVVVVGRAQQSAGTTAGAVPGFRLEGYRLLDAAKGSKYHLRWGCNEADPSVLYFQVEVEAHGYFGLGFNDREGMGGADMVLGWIDGQGNPILEDRYGVSDTEAPVRDKEVNIRLLMAYENATHTVFRWTRAADTKDAFKQDYVMRAGPLEVLWAYTDKDPQGGNPGYHDQRGHVKMSLYDTPRTPPPAASG